MIGSLFSGISGLKTHQAKIEVIGNNLANINTIGYKKSRVTFKEIFNRVVSSGQTPSEEIGGINPVQVGYGVSLGSVDTIMSQGALQATGNPTDLAIKGDGFFVLKSPWRNVLGEGIALTRSGNFGIDHEGNLIYIPNGFRVVGWMADELGSVNTSIEPVGIKLPLNEKIGRPTDEVEYGANLDARAGKVDLVTPGGTGLTSGVVVPAKFLDAGTYEIAITGNAAEGFKASLEGGPAVDISPNQTVTLIKGLPDATLQAIFSDPTLIDEGVATIEVRNGEATVISGGGTGLSEITLPQDSKLSDGIHTIRVSKVAGIFYASLDGGAETEIVAGAAGITLIGADPNQAIQVTFGDTVDAGVVKIRAVSTGEVEVVEDGTTAPKPSEFRPIPASSLESGRHTIRVTELGGGRFVASLDGGPDVEIAPGGTFTLEGGSAGGKIPGGTLTVTFGRDLNAGTAIVEVTSRIRKTSVGIYDSLGGLHNMEITFSKVGENRWQWEVTNVTDAEKFQGSGMLAFEPRTGTVSQIQVFTPIRITPLGGASDLDIAADFSQVTQFASDFDITATNQNGLPIGELESFRVDSSGKVIGIFTNGISRPIAQVALARVPNPMGLERVGDTLFVPSLNSGSPLIAPAGKSGIGEVISGALEMSNVDLTEEFTEMIMAERGFQANSRVITTTDEIIVEALGLKR
jgi:flagellar hook protein FlgE